MDSRGEGGKDVEVCQRQRAVNAECNAQSASGYEGEHRHSSSRPTASLVCWLPSVTAASARPACRQGSVRVCP